MHQQWKLILPGTILALAILAAPIASAQSSGNTAATANNTVCSLNTTNGALIPSSGGGQLFFTGPNGGYMQAQIKLPNSSPGLIVTPSLDTGMYTNTLSSNTMATQAAAIVVSVTDTLGSNTVTLTPNQTCVVDDTVVPSVTRCGVAYDERFQQLTTTNFSNNETVDLILSTLSAHSFNFTEGNVPGGTHTIRMDWVFGCDDGTGTLRTSSCMTTFTPNSAAACAGPGSLTVTQVNNFVHDSPIQSTGP